MIKLFRKFPVLKYYISQFISNSGNSTIPKDFSIKKIKNNNDSKILIFSERFWPIHNAWELYIAKLLETSNFKVTVLLCDGFNTFCDSHSLNSDIQSEVCRECKFNSKKICELHGIEYVSMKDYFYLNKNLDYISSPIDEFTKNDLKKFVECSVVRHLRSNQKNDINWEFIENKFIESLINTDRFLKIFLKENQFDKFFVLNGQFANSKLFNNYAKHINKKFITYERGNIKNTLVFSKNKNAVPFDMNEILNDNSINFNLKLLNNYLNTRSRVGNGHVPFYTDINEDIEKIKEDIKVNLNNRIFVLFTNLIWDSSVYGQDTIFKDMYDWIYKTISFFEQNHNMTLIIRIHPAEEKISWWKTRYTTENFINDNFTKLPQNIKIINAKDSTSSYSLMKFADVGLVYTSTTGLEMALENKPVILCAHSHYSNLNLMYEPKNLEEFYFLLKDNIKPLENQIEKIQKYLYLLYFEKMVNIPDLDECKTFKYKITSLKQSDNKFKNKILNLFND